MEYNKGDRGWYWNPNNKNQDKEEPRIKPHQNIFSQEKKLGQYFFLFEIIFPQCRPLQELLKESEGCVGGVCNMNWTEETKQ